MPSACSTSELVTASSMSENSCSGAALMPRSEGSLGPSSGQRACGRAQFQQRHTGRFLRLVHVWSPPLTVSRGLCRHPDAFALRAAVSPIKTQLSLPMSFSYPRRGAGCKRCFARLMAIRREMHNPPFRQRIPVTIGNQTFGMRMIFTRGRCCKFWATRAIFDDASKEVENAAGHGRARAGCFTG